MNDARKWAMTIAANLAFGNEAVDAYKSSKHHASPGGSETVLEEWLEIVSLAGANISQMAGIKPSIDVTQLPSRERVKEIFLSAGFSVRDKTEITTPQSAQAAAPEIEEGAAKQSEQQEEDGDDNPEQAGHAPKRSRRK